ncbi:helix-turn-helix domain-containing protein [Mucilaginibacter terrigena]|uniref:Helix-turn-helix domain-containing protein n=1 Tax=Mucilaginibacter terrigena TaxID=2492395 RepID=A0A4Q5LN62_9SPHI|nr:helix-turn-helix domain-containing protein [Mucilaginibacter terrigena]RYU90702.1 helix-turn-helix domain-containing protein [Mucilaginibacter terrigena]
MKKTRNQEFENQWGQYEIGRVFFYAPAAIVEDQNLSFQARILFLIINSYCKNKGYCYAGIETLCKKMALKETMLKKYKKELKDNQIIKTSYKRDREHPSRIYIRFDTLMERYPKLPIRIPEGCRLSHKAEQRLRNARKHL